MPYYTAEDVLKALELMGNSCCCGGANWEELPVKFAVLLGEEPLLVEKVATDGGGENAYDTFVILKVGNQLFRKMGHYQSHCGNDWDGPFTEVRQAEKSVTVYEDK